MQNTETLARKEQFLTNFEVSEIKIKGKTKKYIRKLLVHLRNTSEKI